MAFDINTARPISAGKGFDISTAKPIKQEPKKSILPTLNEAMSGLVGSSADDVKMGLNVRDIPHIAAKAVSGRLAGIPEVVNYALRDNPLAGPMQMTSGVKSGRFDLMPKPFSEGGKRMGEKAEITAGFIPMREAASYVSNKAKSFLPKAQEAIRRTISQGKTEIPKAKGKIFKEIVADRAEAIAKVQNVNKRMAEKEGYEFSKQMAGEIERIGGEELNKGARASALKAYKKLPEYYKKNFDEYEDGLERIFTRNKTSAKESEILRSLESTLSDLGLSGPYARSPSGTTESALVKIADEMRQSIASTSKSGAYGEGYERLLSPEFLRNLEKTVKSTLPKGNKLYTADQHAYSVFRENYGGVMEKYVKGLKELNSKYSKFFKVKRQSNKIFTPYMSETEIKTAENLMRQFGKGKLKGTGEEQFIKMLEKEMGEKFTDDVIRSGEKLRSAESFSEAGKRKIKTDLQQKIIELEAKKRKIERKPSEKIVKGIRSLYNVSRGRII